MVFGRLLQAPDEALHTGTLIRHLTASAALPSFLLINANIYKPLTLVETILTFDSKQALSVFFCVCVFSQNVLSRLHTVLNLNQSVKKKALTSGTAANQMCTLLCDISRRRQHSGNRDSVDHQGK